MHLNFNHAIALTGLAAASFDIKAEPTRLISTSPSLLRLGEEFSNRREETGISRGIRPRGSTDRTLVDSDDLIQVFKSYDVVLGLWINRAHAVLSSGYDGIEGLVD